MMAFAPYQPPMGGYNYQAPYMPYVPPRFDAPQQPQNAPGMASMPGGVSTPPQPQTGFLCRPVTSKQEADVFQIPFDGSTTYFVDTSNGNLYSKTFDFDTGKAPVVTYVREVSPPAAQYATVDQLNAVLEEIERLKKPTGKKVVKNDEPNE